MASREFFVPNGGPGSNDLLRIPLIESGVSGIFRPTFEEAAESVSYPSLAASIAAGASRICAVDRPVSISNATTPTVQPSAANNGAVFIGTKASGNQTYTLPAVTVLGLWFTFICGDAAGELLINPAAAPDVISLKATVDQGANITTAAGVGIKNTAATNVLGDLITLISDGVSKWWMIGQSGIWASQ